MTDLDLFLIPQGTLPWQPIKVKNWRFYGPIYFVALPFGNGLQYHNSDFKTLDRMNFSTLYTILVTFGQETPEFTLLLTIAPSAYHAKYLRMTYFTDLVGALVGMIFQIFVWRSPKGRCSRGTTFTLCFGI